MSSVAARIGSFGAGLSAGQLAASLDACVASGLAVVDAHASVDQIEARTAVDAILPCASADEVAAAERDDGVVAAEADDHVRPVGAAEVVVAGSADDVRDLPEAPLAGRRTAFAARGEHGAGEDDEARGERRESAAAPHQKRNPDAEAPSRAGAMNIATDHATMWAIATPVTEQRCWAVRPSTSAATKAIRG